MLLTCYIEPVYSEFLGELVMCDVTCTSVLAFVSPVRSPPTSYSLGTAKEDLYIEEHKRG